MAKRPSLAESMKSVQQTPSAPIPATAEEGDRSPGQGYFAATRVGMKRITVAVSPDQHKRLKRLSVDEGVSIENLMREALADLFSKRG